MEKTWMDGICFSGTLDRTLILITILRLQTMSYLFQEKILVMLLPKKAIRIFILKLILNGERKDGHLVKMKNAMPEFVIIFPLVSPILSGHSRSSARYRKEMWVTSGYWVSAPLK